MASDALKVGIANYVANALKAIQMENPDDGEAELAVSGLAGLGIESIEVHQISNLEVQLRVKVNKPYTQTRYFGVRVSEPI